MKNYALVLIVLVSFALGYVIGIQRKSPVESFMEQCVKTLDADTCIILYAKGAHQ